MFGLVFWGYGGEKFKKVAPQGHSGTQDDLKSASDIKSAWLLTASAVNGVALLTFKRVFTLAQSTSRYVCLLNL